MKLKNRKPELISGFPSIRCPTLIWAVFLSLSHASILLAQGGIEAYDRGALNQASQDLLNDASGSPEIAFLRAALTSNADAALELYRKVVLEYPDSPLSRRAMDRIRQYYYAMGLYSRADEFSQTLRDYHPPKRTLRNAESTPPPPFNLPAEPYPEQSKSTLPATGSGEKPAQEFGYCLQVGAFSSAANAQELKASLEKAGYRVVILDASQTENRLHTVRIVGFENEADALSAAERLKSKFNLHPIVLPEDSNR